MRTTGATVPSLRTTDVFGPTTAQGMESIAHRQGPGHGQATSGERQVRRPFSAAVGEAPLREPHGRGAAGHTENGWGSAKGMTRRARRGPWRAQPSPKGPTRTASLGERINERVGDGFPLLGLPYLVGAARKGRSKRGNQAGGGAASPFAHTLTSQEQGGQGAMTTTPSRRYFRREGSRWALAMAAATKPRPRSS